VVSLVVHDDEGLYSFKAIAFIRFNCVSSGVVTLPFCYLELGASSLGCVLSLNQQPLVCSLKFR